MNWEASPASERSLSSLRNELVAVFQNLSNLSDNSLFIEVPSDEEQHNNLSPLFSPLFSLSDLPSPSHQSSFVSLAPSPFNIQSVSILSENPSLILRSIQLTPLISTTTNCNMVNPSSTSQAQVQPVVPQLQQLQAPTYIQIPSQGKRGALTIDIKKPRQLIQFFKDLELLFMGGGVTSEAEKKEMVLWYVKLELEEVWGRYPDFKDQTKTTTTSRTPS